MTREKEEKIRRVNLMRKCDRKLAKRNKDEKTAKKSKKGLAKCPGMWYYT